MGSNSFTFTQPMNCSLSYAGRTMRFPRTLYHDILLLGIWKSLCLQADGNKILQDSVWQPGNKSEKHAKQDRRDDKSKEKAVK